MRILPAGVSMSNILAIGSDSALLYTRSLVLERTGAEVIRVGPDRAMAMLRTGSFDLVVLCHSLGAETVLRICSEVRAARMPARLLVLLSPGMSQMAMLDVDCHLLLEDGPKELVRVARRLLDSASLGM